LKNELQSGKYAKGSDLVLFEVDLMLSEIA